VANAHKGEVGLEVNGTPYTLRPTFNCLCDLEELTGKSFMQVGIAASRGSTVAIRQLVWAYLQEYHADEIKTVKDAGDWILRAGGLDVVNKALERLAGVNTDEDAKAKAAEDRPRKARGGTGARSTSKRAVSA
jgi:hypothetical protein